MQKVFLSILVSCLLFLTGCWSLQSQEKLPLVINVLDKKEYDDCHIPTSVHVPFDKVDAYVRDRAKDTYIIVYCSNYTCSTSHFVVQKLLANGYTNAYVYSGGMAEWFLAGYPVEGNATADYLKKVVAAPESEITTVPTISVKELANVLKIV